MKLKLDHFYFSVENIQKAVKFYEQLLDIKATHIEGDRWADFEIEGQEGMYFGLINANVLENKRISGNNATLGIYTDDIEKNKTDIETFENNIEEIIDICKIYTRNILFIGLTRVNEKYTVPISWNHNESYFNKNIEKYNQKIKECCIKKKIAFLNILDKMEMQNLSSDGIHPNEMGHRKLFEILKEELMEG